MKNYNYRNPTPTEIRAEAMKEVVWEWVACTLCLAVIIGWSLVLCC